MGDVPAHRVTYALLRIAGCNVPGSCDVVPLMHGTGGEEAIRAIRPGGRADATSEHRLIRAAQRGSADALESLVRLHWTRAVQIAYAIVGDRGVAEDLAQESMIAAVRSLDRFDRRRPFAPWLHRIVTNRAIDWTRTAKRRAEVGLEEVAGDERSSPDPPSAQLIAAMRSLNPEDRAIVAMAHLLGWSAKEIGAALDLKPGTVRSRMSRALARLRSELSGEPSDTGGGS